MSGLVSAEASFPGLEIIIIFSLCPQMAFLLYLCKERRKGEKEGEGKVGARRGEGKEGGERDLMSLLFLNR